MRPYPRVALMDNQDMDRECAEVFLRRFAEVQLRRASLDGGSRARWRVSTVGNALVRAGALDASVAEAIDEDVEFALTVREPHPPVPRRRQPGGQSRPVRVARTLHYQAGTSQAGSFQAFQPGVPQASRPQARSSAAMARIWIAGPQGRSRQQPRRTADHVVPLDIEIQVASDEGRWVLYLLAFCQGDGGAWFTMYLRPADRVADQPDELPSAPHLGTRFSSVVDLMNSLRMTDDTRADYQLTFRGGGNEDQGFHGQLDILPDPPSVRWAEITAPGQSAVRVDLTGVGDRPAITLTQETHTPGEYVLHAYAARLLGQGALHLADVLGDLVAALRACGALSSLSPVPGQLARLCELHDVRDHGIAAAPARDEDLPEPWRIDTRWVPAAPYPRNCFAAATVVLPELDGIRLTILGLTSTAMQTWLHIHATGVAMSHRNDNLPVLWIRDDLGGWHATFPGNWSSADGESRAHLTVSPPLNRASAIDILLCGRTAEVRATLPLRWR
jgi:hypothetical protein